jgi:hypothetical protein
MIDSAAKILAVVGAALGVGLLVVLVSVGFLADPPRSVPGTMCEVTR